MGLWFIDRFRHIDWFIVTAASVIAILGIFTMYGFSDGGGVGKRQIVWLIISLGVFFVTSQFEYRVLRRTGVVIGIYGSTLLLLVLVTIRIEMFVLICKV